MALVEGHIHEPGGHCDRELEPGKYFFRPERIADGKPIFGARSIVLSQCPWHALSLAMVVELRYAEIYAVDHSILDWGEDSADRAQLIFDLAQGLRKLREHHGAN